MPAEEEYQKEDEIVYRCPYIPDCPGNYNCFALAAPKPIDGQLLININCHLCRRKIPIYVAYADRVVKK